jgi:exodeoxyribonuclease VII small subunit
MSLPKFSVNQSLFINLFSVIIVLVGLNVVMGMNKEVFPNVTFDQVSVTTVYPGGTPEDVEKLITTPIEKELKQVDGIKEITSSSSFGISVLGVEIEPDEKDKQKVIRDIQSYVDRVNDLPKDVDDPIVTEVESKQFPIIEVSLSGDMTEKQFDLDASLKNLEEIVTKMEAGDLKLDEALKLFEKGVQLTRASEKYLSETELKIMDLGSHPAI